MQHFCAGARRRAIAACCLGSALLLALAGPEAAAQERAWTILFYDDADFQWAFDPFADFIADAYATAEVAVLILRDTESGGGSLYALGENHEATLLEDWGEPDLGGPEALRDFVLRGKALFPAERYLLMVYDHGYAWRGCCWDDTGAGWLKMPELRQALTEAGGVDLLAFTAPCTMAALESAYELRDCVDVYLGSEEGSGYRVWDGFMGDVVAILDTFHVFGTAQTAAWIIEELAMSGLSGDAYDYLTMSAIASERLDAAIASLDALSDYVTADYAACAGDVYRARREAFELARMLEIEGYFLVDAWDFLRRLELQASDPALAALAAAAKAAVLQSVVAQCHGPLESGARGLNLFFPVREQDWSSSYVSELAFAADTSWDELLLASLSWTVPTGAAVLPPGPPTCTPNPFRDETRFTFGAAPAATSLLSLYDIRGRLVRSIPVGGADHAVWDGRDEAGARLASGVYLSVLDRGDGRRHAGRVVLLR
jgi:hypothetical protein